MHAGALKALEFDRVVEAVRSFALTPLGDARLGALRPQTDFRAVQTALTATTEAVNYLGDNPIFPLDAPRDLEPILAGLAIEARALEPSQLLSLADFLASVEHARGAIRQASGAFPVLRAIAETVSTFEQEVAEVRRKIEPSGEVVDHASAELRTIRERLRKQRARLRGTLESYLRGKETARYLQEQIITDRGGRYVLVIKAEHRTAIPGIVHGSSTSGASLFLEPLSTVEVNNDIVALEDGEAAEVRRILLGLANAFRKRALDLHRTLQAVTELDVLQAKARFAQLVGGVEPALTTDGRFELQAARHPLLIAGVAARLGAPAHEVEPPREVAAQPVPVDLLLIPPTTALVVTGPNTGGKTVALKTAGLHALMAQAGLHLPAASGSQLPVFRSIFADIGDEQSIAANLSTFSWHVTNIASMDRALALPALVLLDEIGAGTDPMEGGALGMAVIEHFRQRGALVVATTHDEMLKSYASTAAGVSCAAFGFDPETFAPTFKLTYGSSGRSLALEIAARLGLAASIVASAREYRSSREAQLAEHLAKVDHDLQDLDHARRQATRERDQLTENTVRLQRREAELAQGERALQQRVSEGLDRRLRDARREIDEVVEDLKRRTDALAIDAAGRSAAYPGAISTGESGAMRTQARVALQSVAEQFRHTADVSTPLPRHNGQGAEPSASPAVGDRVIVGGLGLEGLVQLVQDREAEIDVRGKRVRVPLEGLRIVGAGASTAATGRVSVQLQPRDGPLTELNVIGCRVDEAVSRAEKFLDDALIAEERLLRVIHGHGTGQLRRALADFLRGHPLVERFEAAPPEQGGAGVTIVELRE